MAESRVIAPARCRTSQSLQGHAVCSVLARLDYASPRHRRSEKSCLQEQAERLGTATCFVGEVDDAGSCRLCLLKRVCASLTAAAFGIVLIEAMRAGLLHREHPWSGAGYVVVDGVGCSCQAADELVAATNQIG
jgi:hypothetical protein